MLGRVYYASGWFNPKADEEERRVLKKIRELGFDVFSPRDEFVLSPNEGPEKRKEIFEQNVREMNNCDIFFGITDYKDMGTLWECGCVHGINTQTAKQRKIVYYAETLPEGAPFNVMLAEPADVVITKFEDLDKLPEWLEVGHKYEGNVQ